MEIRTVEKYAGWYASYMEDDQGLALIECMQKRIQADERLLNNILAEIELCDDPVEKSPEVILHSIKDMISGRGPVSARRGWYEWNHNATAQRESAATDGCREVAS